jgi:MFS family permease
VVKRNVVVAALGTTQNLAWGSSYYLPAILAEPIAQGLGLSRAMVFGVFSGSLLLSAFLGPAVGRAIDNRGGRGVLVLSNLGLAAGLVLLAFAQGVIGLAAAWAVLGVGMALGPLRCRLRHAHRPLRAGGTRTDHGDHSHCRFREHDRLATLGLSRRELGLARRLPHLGGT